MPCFRRRHGPIRTLWMPPAWREPRRGRVNKAIIARDVLMFDFYRAGPDSRLHSTDCSRYDLLDWIASLRLGRGWDLDRKAVTSRLEVRRNSTAASGTGKRTDGRPAAQRANSFRIASPWAPTAGDGPSSTFSPAKICGGAGIDTGPVGVPMSTRRNCGCRANCPTVFRLPNATFADRSAAVRSA